MAEQSEVMLVELALRKRLLTRKQADLVREELQQIPKSQAGELMLRRHYVTVEQLEALRLEAETGGLGDNVDPPTPRGLQALEETQKASDAPPSLAELRARREQQVAAGTAGHMPQTGLGAPMTAPGAQQLSISQLRAQQAAAAGQPAAAEQPQYQQASYQPAANLQQQAPAAPQQAAAAAPAPAPAPAQPAQQPVTTSGGMPPRKRLAHLLRIARHWSASDLHISVGRPPFVRLYGQLRYMEEPPLSAEECEAVNFAALSDEQAELARKNLQLDYPLDVPKLGRYRCNLFRQRLGWDAAYRVIRATVPTLEELGLPATLKQLTEHHQGLVLVTGSGGAGKTTTAAALIDLVNEARQDHIITVEDPVEYVIPAKNCQVTQREVGRHTQSFANALRAALREDPDIILIGELRDLETTSIAISAAETGHLVFTTLNTSSAARSVAKIVDFYPISQQSQVLTMVSESLRGVVTQQMIPRRDTAGLVIALEVLINTSGIAQQIKEGKTHMITSLLQGGKKQGMLLMDDSLMMLAKAGYISGKEAYRRASQKQGFESMKDAD